MSPLLLFLVIGVIGWAMAGPKPRGAAYTAWQQAQRQRARAHLAAARRTRQAWRRRVFGSHPVLYGALAWLSPLLLLALLALLH